jgi:hypothetical protein
MRVRHTAPKHAVIRCGHATGAHSREARTPEKVDTMLKAGDRVFIEGTNQEGVVKEVHAHEATVRVAVPGGHEERKFAHESLRLDPTLGEVSNFVDH